MASDPERSGRRTAKGVETLEFLVGQINPQAGDDLRITVTGISGVARIALDLTKGALSVEYDPNFVRPLLVKRTIEGAGYEVAGVPE